MTLLKTSLKKNDLRERKLVRTDVDGKYIVFTNLKSNFYAIDSICSHRGGPLEEGTLEGYILVCPWHQGIFDIRTAKAFPETNGLLI